ncbi:MAG TPA: hypothetical protein VFU43_11850 [Streptosporangiaceae bacterium]|nr:hypothetical protein [Streptosporangiaceae bacterium]
MDTQNACEHDYGYWYMHYGAIDDRGAERSRDMREIYKCAKCGDVRLGEDDTYYGHDMDTKQGEPSRLDYDQMAEYERLLSENLTGAEQAAMRERDPEAYEAWSDAQMKHVPMPFWQKPDINGLREGDCVRLTRSFRGERLSFDAGRTGVVLISDTSPGQIRVARETGLCEVVIEGPDGGLIGVLRDDIEKITGRRRVSYNGDYFRITDN